MVSWIMLLLWNLNFIMDGKAQIYTCPYEDGLFYATSPDCLTYYLCENRMLWSGVCFPWQRFDVHKLACRQLTQVDCNPEYAGIWRQIYGTEQEDGEEGIGDEETEDAEEKEFQDQQKPQVVAETEAQKIQEEDALDQAEGGKQASVQEELEPQDVSEKEAEAVKDKQTQLQGDSEKQDAVGDSTPGEDKKVQAVGDKNIQAKEKIVLEKNSGEESALERYDNKKSVNLENILGEEVIAKEMKATIEDETPISLGEVNSANDNPVETKCLPENASTCTTIVPDDNEVQDKPLTQTKQLDSLNGYWYWCGSGRFVFAQNNEDGNTICLQLQDPEFVNREDGTQQGGAWAGHTFLGTDDST